MIYFLPTLHVSNQQVSFRPLVHPMLEGATLAPRFGVPPHQVDLLAVLHRILDKVTDQLLLQRGVWDVARRPVNQVDGNDPVCRGGREGIKGFKHFLCMAYDH